MRYYTYVIFSESLKRQRYVTRRDAAKYPHAPTGFVFHDDEQPLGLYDIRLPLQQIRDVVEHENYELIAQGEEVPKRALVYRVDASTLVATFSMSGFPYPTKEDVWSNKDVPVYPAPAGEGQHNLTDELHGWLISDVSKLSTSETEVSFGDIYDNCEQLTRLSGMCPCDMLKTGDCMKYTVLPQLPDDFLGPMHTYYEIEPRWFERVARRSMGGFEYVKPSYTNTVDFGNALRPFDTHDFSVVEQRREEFSKRGLLRKKYNKLIKEECSRCTSALTDYKGEIVDCGYKRACEGAKTLDDYWRKLLDIYNTLQFQDMPYIPNKVRDYIMHLGFLKIRSKGITGARFIDANVAGLIYDPYDKRWFIHIVPYRGDLNRHTYYVTYEAFYNDLHPLSKEYVAAPDKIPSTDISDRARVAYANTARYVYRHYYRKGRYPVYRVSYDNRAGREYIETSGINSGNYELDECRFCVNEPVTTWLEHLGYHPLITQD